MTDMQVTTNIPHEARHYQPPKIPRIKIIECGNDARRRVEIKKRRAELAVQIAKLNRERAVLFAEFQSIPSDVEHAKQLGIKPNTLRSWHTRIT